jgi:hypothetical protein
MASFVIHDKTDIQPIKLITPSDINVSDTTSTVSVVIPANSYIGVGTGAGYGDNYFNYNYCAYVTIVFYKDDGTVVSQVPDSTIIQTMQPQSGSIDNSNYYPALADFKKFSNAVILFHTGTSSSTHQSNWTHTLSEEKKIDVTVPTGADYYEVYISGCSMNTTTYRRYVYDPWYKDNQNSNHPYGETVKGDKTWTIPSWATKPGYSGGNSCGHTHTPTDEECSELLWDPLTGGSITLSDNKNYLAITGTNFKKGTSNKIDSSTLQITFKDSAGSSLNTSTAKTPYIVSVGTTSEGAIDKDISIATVVASDDLAKVTQVTVKLAGVGKHGDTIETAESTINIKYYTCPAAPSSLWYTSNNKSSLNGTFKPSYKKDITWNWSGAAGGTNAPVVGYRVFFVNETKSVYIDTDIDNITATNKLKTESGEGKNPCYETTGTTMKFNPQKVGFAKDEICTCYVYTYSTWGNGDKLFSNNNRAPRYPGDRAVKSAQCTFGGSTIWINVPKSSSDPTLVWKEGTVYVHNGTTWKEAEGVYVHNGSSWKEST